MFPYFSLCLYLLPIFFIINMYLHYFRFSLYYCLFVYSLFLFISYNFFMFYFYLYILYIILLLLFLFYFICFMRFPSISHLYYYYNLISFSFDLKLYLLFIVPYGGSLVFFVIVILYLCRHVDSSEVIYFF